MTVTKISGDKFQARVGDFFGPIRSTKPDAIAGLYEQLENYHPLTHEYVRCGDGTVLHLFQIPSHGWNIRIIPPTGYIGTGKGIQESTLGKAQLKAQMLADEKFGGVSRG